MGGIIPECIIDANVIFDAVAGDVLPEIFELGYRIITTDFVMGEIESIPHPELITLGLIVQDMPGELVGEMLTVKEEHIELSIADVSVLVLSKHTGATVLSGDGPLRKAATKTHLTLHGTLWLIDEMIDNKIIRPDRAVKALQAMCDSDRWLPEEECRRRIRMWAIEKTKNKALFFKAK